MCSDVNLLIDLGSQSDGEVKLGRKSDKIVVGTEWLLSIFMKLYTNFGKKVRIQTMCTVPVNLCVMVIGNPRGELFERR